MPPANYPFFIPKLDLHKHAIKKALEQAQNPQKPLKKILRVKELKTPIFPMDSKDPSIGRDALIRVTTTKLYKNHLNSIFGKDTISKHPEILMPPGLANLVLPALLFRNVMIRPPRPEEKDEIMDNAYYEFAYVDEDEFIESIIDNYGTLNHDKKIERILLITDRKGTILGSIHYTVSLFRHKCDVHAIKVLEERKGYGSLLLCVAFLDAYEQGCTKVKLYAQPSAGDFYDSFGLEYTRDQKERDVYALSDQTMGLIEEKIKKVLEK